MNTDYHQRFQQAQDLILSALRSNNGATIAEISRHCPNIDRLRVGPILQNLLAEEKIFTGAMRHCQELNRPMKTFWLQ